MSKDKLLVYKTCCKNCIFTENRIVSKDRAQSILSNALRKGTYFICHSASIRNKDIVCRRFYDEHRHHSRLIQVAERLDVLEFVEQPDNRKLPSHSQMSDKEQNRR